MTLFGKSFEETCNSAWMNDLIAWTKRQIQEARNGNTWLIVTLGESIANVMNVFCGIAAHVEILLRPDDVDALAIIDNLANEGNILERKNCKFFSFDVISQNAKGLKVKSSLAKDGSDECSTFEVRLDLLENIILCVGWRANNDYVSTWDYFRSIIRNFTDLTCHFSFVLPG